VQKEITSQLAVLSTAATAQEAVNRQGFYVVCQDPEEALAVVNSIGPEHLEVITKNSEEVSFEFDF
jgi:histidinol dehydrogenase